MAWLKARVLGGKRLRRAAAPLIALALVFFSLHGCAPRIPYWSGWGQQRVTYEKVHIVRKGETLYSISRLYGVSPEAIVQTNGIRDPDRLEIGWRLRIPRGDSISRLYQHSTSRTEARPASLVRPSKLLIWPISGTVVRKFSVDAKDPHKGIDISAPEGSHVQAVEDGTVLFSGVGPEGYGLMVIVEHDNRLVTVYAHNKANLVKVDQRVSKSQRIAYVGRSGNSTGPYLHFEVRLESDPIDPLGLLEPQKRP